MVRTVHLGDPDEKPSSVLTAGLIREFERRRNQQAEKRATNANRATLIYRARNSTASFVRQARSVVALRKMKFYEDLKLPDLTSFRGETVETPQRSLPRPLDMAALSAMEAAVSTLADEDPAVYVAHLLFSRLGLRNIEIVSARSHWINDGSIGIINRAEENFFPKGCEGWVPIAPDVLTEIQRFQSLTTNDYLVPGRTHTERHQAVYRRHSKWVSQWIKDRTKTSYELRRYAGSRLLDMGATVFIVLASLLLFGVLGFWMVEWGIGLGRSQNYQPEQPIFFSHRIHAGLNQISCLLCHSNAWESKQASVPSPNICMNCHAAINDYHGERLQREDGTIVSPNDEIKKLFSYAGYNPEKGKYTEREKPIEWIKIHNLPDHVFFSHAQHVRAGKVQCQTCHGPVQEMDEVKQFAPLSMGWCINCHRTSKVDFPDSTAGVQGNKFYSIYTKFARELRTGQKDSVTVEDIGGTDCQKCHY